jgi:hypothetical protein
MLDWFRTEVQVLPTAFTECNKNITCFVLVGVFKKLAGVECDLLPELKNMLCCVMPRCCTMSSAASAR